MLFKHLAAQAEKRRLQQAQQRAELEMLRTGRTIETSSDSPGARPTQSRDNEERRREELAELRRRAAARRSPQTQTQSRDPIQAPTPTPARSPAPNPLELLLGLPPGTTTGGTVSPVPMRTPKTRAQRGESESKKRRLEQQRLRAQQLAAEARRNQERLEQQARAARAAATVEQRLLRDAKPVSPAPVRAAIGIAPRSAADWRRAIVMNEILSKPVSLR